MKGRQEGATKTVLYWNPLRRDVRDGKTHDHEPGEHQQRKDEPGDRRCRW